MSFKGYKHTEKTKRKMRYQKLGDKNPAKGLDVRKKLSEMRKGKRIGKDNPNWRGGISKCKNCGGELSKYGYPKRGTIYCKECYIKKLSEGGENHPNWKGGISKNEYKIRQRERMAGRKKSEQCEICGAMDNICFDHDHKTENFRGWICRRCNLALGLVKDNKELLSAMIKYLIK